MDDKTVNDHCFYDSKINKYFHMKYYNTFDKQVQILNDERLKHKCDVCYRLLFDKNVDDINILLNYYDNYFYMFYKHEPILDKYYHISCYERNNKQIFQQSNKQQILDDDELNKKCRICKKKLNIYANEYNGEKKDYFNEFCIFDDCKYYHKKCFEIK